MKHTLEEKLFLKQMRVLSQEKMANLCEKEGRQTKYIDKSI